MMKLEENFSPLKIATKANAGYSVQTFFNFNELQIQFAADMNSRRTAYFIEFLGTIILSLIAERTIPPYPRAILAMNRKNDD